MAVSVKLNSDELNLVMFNDEVRCDSRLVYLHLRLNMDYSNGITGRKTSGTKRLNWQSVREALHEAPKRGRASKPDLKNSQVRACLDELIRVGAIENVSNESLGERFVFKLILADTDLSASNIYNVTKSRFTTQVNQDLQHSDNDEKASVYAVSQEYNSAFTSVVNVDLSALQKPIYNTPPDTVIQTDKQTARAREIPADFHLNDILKAQCRMYGVDVRVAEYVMPDFVLKNEHKNWASHNWGMEFIRFCKKQLASGKVPDSVFSNKVSAFDGFKSVEDVE